MRKRNLSRKAKHKDSPCISPDYVSATTGHGIMRDIAACFGSRGRYVVPSVVAACGLQGAVFPMGQVYAINIPPTDGVTVSGANSMIVPSTSGGSSINSVSGVTVKLNPTNNTDGLTVFSGGLAVSTTVADLGRIHVSAGGVVSNTTISGILSISGGSAIVSAGGTAIETTINRGYLIADSGGIVSKTNVQDGLLHVSGGSAFDSTIQDGHMQVHGSGAVAINTTLNSGSMSVFDKGTATNTTVNGGYMFVFGPGTTGVVQTSVTSTTVNGGSMSVIHDALASDTIVNSGGHLQVGSYVDHTTVNGGTVTLLYAGNATSTTINDGQMDVSGGNVTSTTVNSGQMNIHTSGKATDTTISGGTVTVNSGGFATSTTIDGGQMDVSGGNVTSTTVNSGQMNIHASGTATDTTISSGIVTVISGGSMTNTTLNGGEVYLFSGTATSTTINGGSMTLRYSDTTATNTTINSGGEMLVLGTRFTLSSGHYQGTAIDTTINSGGNMIVTGIASNTTVNSGGVMEVGALRPYPFSVDRFDGLAHDTEINDGGTVIADYGSIMEGNTVIHSGGSLTARNATIHGLTMDGGLLQNDTADKNAILTDVVSGYGDIRGVGDFTLSNGNISLTSGTINTTGTLFVQKIQNTAQPAISLGDASFHVGNVDVSNLDAGTATSGTLIASNAALSNVQLTSGTDSGTLDSTNPSVVFGGGATTDSTISGFVLDYIAPNATYTLTNSDKKIDYFISGMGQATKLTFGNIDWLDTGAFIDHAAQFTNIDFNGADVDTTNIHFKNVSSLEANKTMKLVSSFGTSVGTIVGTKYTVGTTLQGNGKAELNGTDLIYKVETTATAPSGGGGSGGGGSSGSGSGSSSGGGSGSEGSSSFPSGGNSSGTGSSSVNTLPSIPDNIINNIVNFSENTADNLYGGYARNNASGNTVNITGGTVNGNVYGGYGINGNANNNTVNIAGGTIRGSIYGGYSEHGETRNNTVNLYGAADVSAANIFGGNREHTGNILNVGDAATKTPWTGGNQYVRNIANFERINFLVVPWSSERPALTITDGALSNLSYTTVSAQNVHFTDVDILSRWDRMTLLNASAITDSTRKLAASNIISDSNYTVGTTGQGTGTVSLDENGNVVYRVDTYTDGKPIVTAQEQTHNTLMGMEAGMAALHSGQEFIGKTIDGLADLRNKGEDGISVFAAMGGGTAKYSTGSHIKENTWNAVLGIGTTRNFDSGSLEWGGFVEHGSGNFSLHGGESRGDGSSIYTGGGFVAKWMNKRNNYVEASLRFGRSHDSASNLLHDVLGNSYGYNVHANYYGGHVGIGKVYRFRGDRSLDVYGKFFTTHRKGVSFDAGGQYELDSLHSNILRLGARYTAKKGNCTWYGDLSYEHEFSGEATGTADGMPIRSASVRGGSVRAEVGVRIKPSQTSPWNVDIGLTGYGGKHRGLSGMVAVGFHF